MSQRNTVLEVKNLAIGYRTKGGTIPVSQNINFALEEGKLVGLVGTNGIGKSTLLKTIIDMIPSLDGNILFKGVNSKQLSIANLAKQISVVLTEPLATKNLTALELVALGRQPYTNWIGSLNSKDKFKIDDAFKRTQIEDLKHKKCFEMSDGQLQKVLIARALAQDTPLMILDEPTTHLDMYHKAFILNLLKKLAVQTNTTILFSTHELDMAIQICDELIVMLPNDIKFGTPKELIEEGVFDKLFPNDLISFDKEIEAFKVIK